MKKVIIIGTTGSGKSTVSKKLAKKINASYIQLDQVFWKPNWTWSTDEELFEKIKKEIQCESWVIDGNYTRSQFITWPEADTVIWIDLPFWLTFYQSFTRTFKRSFHKMELWPNTGNRETFSRMFSKDSILLWLFKNYWKNKVNYVEKMNDPKFSHLTFYRLRSRKEINHFLINIK